MKNAFSGYSYQKQVTLLLLMIMDVERKISKIEIEAKTIDNFDDLVISTNSESFYFQIKDFKDVSINDLEIQKNEISIKGKIHKLSSTKNILFFKNISIKPNEKILNFSSYKLSNDVSIISLSRVEADGMIEELYKDNLQRKNELHEFFNSILDDRIWEISKDDLPQLKVFITELQEKSVLSRPLTKELQWKKHILENWNKKQTKKVLETSFYITEYSVTDKIFKISQGYPIIVKYLAEHYKLHKVIPKVEQVKDIDTYYHNKF